MRNIKLISILAIATYGLPSCSNEPTTTATPPFVYGKVAQVTEKPIRDTQKGAVYDVYRKTVTVTYDSLVPVGIIGNTPPPVDPPPVDPPPTTGYTATYKNGFDSKADLDPDDHGQLGNGSLSTSIYKTGPGSFHSVPANVSSGIRSEVQFDASRTGNEGAVDYDAYYVKVQANSIHTAQFHPNTSGGSASPGLWTVNGQFAFVNWYKGTNTKYSSNYTIPNNKWIHIRWEYKFGSSGYLRLIVDGAKLIDRSGIQVGDGSGQYFKLGSNSWSGTGSDIYYDNLVFSRKS